ncbi:hypothetical protein QOL99_17155, partial [Deinococcus sp. MIMF12]|nr:hypothetical protein [Deinococcus rhizophilus]
MTTLPSLPPTLAHPERRDRLRAAGVTLALHGALLLGLLALRPDVRPTSVSPPDLDRAPLEVVTLAPPPTPTAVLTAPTRPASPVARPETPPPPKVEAQEAQVEEAIPTPA